MSSIVNKIHFRIGISCQPKRFNTLHATLGVHPIMIAICQRKILMRWVTCKETWNVQTKATGIFSLSIRSTRGMRAWAPGARIWADCGRAHQSINDHVDVFTHIYSIRRNPLQGWYSWYSHACPSFLLQTVQRTGGKNTAAKLWTMTRKAGWYYAPFQ